MKKSTQILIYFFIAVFLIGKTAVEFISQNATMNTEISLISEQKGDNLTIKIPLQLPYHERTEFFDHINELIIFNGDFYRSYHKVFENDTLYTQFTKESVSRQNIVELLQQVSKNFDENSKHSEPFKNLNNLLKTLSFQYYISQDSNMVYFWNYIQRNVFQNFDSKPLLTEKELFSPPPQSFSIS